MNAPAPQRPAAPDPMADSLWLGFALGWAVIIGGYAVFGGLAIFGHSEAGMIAALVVPWLVLFGLIVYFALNGKPRTATGLAISIAAILGVIGLLVAACFGLLINAYH